MKEGASPKADKKEVPLDEEFLCSVDRAMLLDKQNDPFRLRQVARVAEEEAQRAHLMKEPDVERRSHRDRA